MPSPLVSVRTRSDSRTGPGGDQELQLHAVPDGGHLQEVALAGANLLDDAAHTVAGHVHHQALDGLALFAVDLLEEHAGGETWNS